MERLGVEQTCHGDLRRVLRLVQSEQTKEGNVLFNDALNTFYLRLYGVEHMVKREREKCFI